MSKYLRSLFVLLLPSLAPGVIWAEPVADRGTSSAATSSSERPEDATIRRALWRRLASDEHVELDKVEVQVQRGIVLLAGTVSASPAGTRAARIARVIEGVRAVVNRVRVEPVRRHDSQVARDVRRSLRRTPALASMPISVAVTRGVVQLSGSITSWDEQQLAESVVAAVPGVRFCQNQLTLARSMRRTAAIMAADVRTRLKRDPYLDRAPIVVEVRRGQVTLSGAVAWPAQRKRAMRHAWVPGVAAVDADELLVAPSLPGQEGLRSVWPKDADIRVAIAELVAYWPQLAASGPTSSVVGGVVTLRGNVPTLADRDAARAMAQSAVGVVEVRDELRGPWWRAPVSPSPAPVKVNPPARRKAGKRTR